MPPKDKRKRKDRIKHKAPPGQPVSGPHGFQGSRPSKPPKERPDKPDRPDRHHPVSTPQTTKPGTSGGYQHPKPSGGVDETAVGSGTAHPGGTPISIGYGPGQVDPALAAAAGIGPAAGGFPGTTVGAGVGVGGTGGISDVQDLFPILGETPPPLDDETPPPDDDDEKETVKYYDDELGGISERDLKAWELKLGQEAIIRNGKVFFRDKTTNKLVPYGKMIRALGGVLDKITGFDPTKAFGEMGDTGKAAMYNKISKMSGPEFEKFLNRKGNLDRLLSYYESEDFEDVSREDFDKILKNYDAQGFAYLIKGSASDSASFQKALDKETNPQKYWDENPPRTSAEAEEAAMSGVSWIEGYGPVERPEGQGGGISDLGGGVGGGAGDGDTTTDTAQATTVPDYILRQQYMPGFTPDYSGGPEQMQIAGGYWDPVAKKWIGQGPWGTQSQYQFNQGGIVGTSPLLFKNQGGMVNDGGIKSFKKYGY